MEQKTFLVNDPSNGNKGSRITSDYMNHINEELSSILTDRGVTPDANDSNQISKVLTSTFAGINSPTLTGIPQTSNPDGQTGNQIATVDYVNQKALQATVGFTPVQQGGGAAMGANKVYIGWASDASGVLVQIDASSMGKIVFQEEDDNTKGISQIGFNTSLKQLGAAYDGIWAFYYSTVDIDAKQFIQSTPDPSGSRITGMVWNTSSNLPAYTYNNGQVSYSATTDWVNEKGYVSGTSLLGDGDIAAVGIHYTPSLQAVQLNLSNSSTVRIASQDWVNGKSYITTYSDGNTYPITEIGYNHVSDNIGFATTNGFAIGATQTWTSNNFLTKSGGTMTGSINMPDCSIGKGGNNRMVFESGGHISIWNSDNQLIWWFANDDANQNTVNSNVPLLVNSYIKSNNPSSGENSNVVATTSWVTNNFISLPNYNYNINQPVTTGSTPTFQGVWCKSLTFNNGGTSSIYQDTNNGDLVMHTNNGSDHFNVFNSDGSVNFGGNSLNVGQINGNGDIRVGSGNWLYTNTIGSYGGTVSVQASLAITGSLNITGEAWTQTYDQSDNGTHIANTSFVHNVANQAISDVQGWANSQFVSAGTYQNDFGTSDGRVFNGAYGIKIQGFTVGGVGERAFVTFPQAFGGIQSVIVQCINDQDTNVHPYTLQNNGFYLHINGGGSCDIAVIAFGNK